MSAEHYNQCTAAEGTMAYLPQTIAAQLEALRLERIRSFADAIYVTTADRRQSELEERVDTLLDSLSTMHQLDKLAAHAARGGQIATDADRLLISENEETYLRMLGEHQTSGRSSARVPHSFLPSGPMPVR